MDHESFENHTIAALMNDLFINIKVDREERPDLDSIYQQALALLRQPGGWPLTMFLTPDARPFFGGTYFPPEPRYGRPGFPEVLEKISEAFHSHADAVAQNAAAIGDALTKLSQPESGAGIPLDIYQPIAERMLSKHRHGEWRHRRCAEVSHVPAPRIAVARLAAQPRCALPRRRNLNADPHVPGRHLRSSRRRLRALQRRCRMACPAF
jgi:hypothetical protein